MRLLLLSLIFMLSSFVPGDNLHWHKVFLDDFDDNRYNWVTPTTDELTRISDGFLFYANPFDFVYYDGKPLAFNHDMDYFVELKFRFLSGDVNGFNGIFLGDLVFGVKNILEITPLGNVRVRYIHNNKAEVLFERKLENLNPTGFNLIGILRQGDKFVYIVNGKEVYQHPYFSLNGKYLGFTISGGTYIQLAHIGMWYVQNK